MKTRTKIMLICLFILLSGIMCFDYSESAPPLTWQLRSGCVVGLYNWKPIIVGSWNNATQVFVKPDTCNMWEGFVADIVVPKWEGSNGAVGEYLGFPATDALVRVPIPTEGMPKAYIIGGVIYIYTPLLLEKVEE